LALGGSMSLNYVDLPGIMDRIVAIEKLITADVGTILHQTFNAAEAYKRMDFESDVYPKWLNGMTMGDSKWGGTGEEGETYTVNTLLQLGKRTQGYFGELEQSIQTWVPYTLAYVRTTPKLKSVTQPTVPVGLASAEIRIGRFLEPGDIIATSFVWSIFTSVSNEERDY
jgi:hypothetical protein